MTEALEYAGVTTAAKKLQLFMEVIVAWAIEAIVFCLGNLNMACWSRSYIVAFWSISFLLCIGAFKVSLHQLSVEYVVLRLVIMSCLFMTTSCVLFIISTYLKSVYFSFNGSQQLTSNFETFSSNFLSFSALYQHLLESHSEFISLISVSLRLLVSSLAF